MNGPLTPEIGIVLHGPYLSVDSTVIDHFATVLERSSRNLSWPFIDDSIPPSAVSILDW